LVNADSLVDISPAPATAAYPSSYIAGGEPIPKVLRVQVFSPDQWETFIQEWASGQKSNYFKVVRSGGAGDKGLDVICFATEALFEGDWDNFQCKRYDHPLQPSDIWIEIGKLVYYTWIGEYTLPRRYYFAGSRDIGTKLARLLAKPSELKLEAQQNWEEHCRKKIVGGVDIPLSDELLDHFDAIDFALFSSKSVLELVEQHSATPFHAVRFGGGLPTRPLVEVPPAEIAAAESRYVEQILEAYSDEAGSKVDHSIVAADQSLVEDFLRQRTRFYNAESLRNFARDTVPPGTFEKLQGDVLDGVIDTCDAGHHEHGRARMRSTLSQAAQLPLSSSPLVSVTNNSDKQGICHQLANADTLKWVKKNVGG